ncbi:unnamed protein product, partial [Ectocarpus sp. 12 AP-2014]
THVQTTRDTSLRCPLVSSALTRGLAAMRGATTRRSSRRSRCFRSSRARGSQPHQRLLCALSLFLVAGAAALAAFGDNKDSMHHSHRHHGGEGYGRTEERRGHPG